MKQHALIALITTGLIAGCTVLNERTGEEALFATLSISGDYEIRAYEPVIIAQTTVSGRYLSATKIGYERLTDYVSGKNLAKQTISVNKPITLADGQKQPKIALTLPYFEEYINDTWVVSVAMPESYSLKALPKPTDKSITFKVLPPLRTAVVKFSGYKSEGLVSRKSAQLNQWIQQNKLVATSTPRSVIYDSPWVIPTLRRHEIHMSIK